MKKKLYKDKVVIITGGSSGIGLALAKEFAAQKAQLVLIARNRERLEHARSMLRQNGTGNVYAISADVMDKEAITNAINEVGRMFGKVDVLINNAGTATHGRFSDQSPGDLEKCLFTNYLGCVYAAKAAWPWLKQAKGKLSFVSSVAGYMGLIGYSSYAPTKFAITGLAECLRMEAEDDGISVSIIYPPDTDTPMLQYEREHTLPECIALSKNIKVKTAEFVARKYIAGLQQNRFEIYCDTDSRLFRWLKNNFPGLSYYVTKRIVHKARNNADKVC